MWFLINFFAFSFQLFFLFHLLLSVFLKISVTIRIAFQDAHDQELETKRDRVVIKGVVLIQKTFRGHRCRKHYMKQRNSLITLQKYWREFADKRRYRTVSLSCLFVKTQYTVKIYILRSSFQLRDPLFSNTLTKI